MQHAVQQIESEYVCRFHSSYCKWANLPIHSLDNAQDIHAELEQLNAAFTIEIKPARFFLGNNVAVAGAVQDGAP